MRRLPFIAGAALLTLLVICLIGYVVYGIISDNAVSIHQQHVTRELEEWMRVYGKISSHQEAIRTAEMLEYVQRYYVPAEGYRSTPEIEAALEMQRKETVVAFTKALRDYTGKDFGSESGKWLKYLHLDTVE